MRRLSCHQPSTTRPIFQVEFESPAHGNPEADLLPVAALALDHRLGLLLLSAITFVTHRMADDSESECGDLEGQLALPGMFQTSMVFECNRFKQEWEIAVERKIA